MNTVKTLGCNCRLNWNKSVFESTELNFIRQGINITIKNLISPTFRQETTSGAAPPRIQSYSVIRFLKALSNPL